MSHLGHRRGKVSLPVLSCHDVTDRVFPYNLGFTVMTLNLKSHSLRKSDTFQYGLEIEKIDFSETLPIFNLYRVMNTNVKNLAICLTVSMATMIF